MDPVESHLKAAEQALKEGHAHEALDEARVILRMQPQNARGLVLEGLAHAMMGDEIEAREAIRRAEELAPRDSAVRYAAYISYGKMGDLAAARAQLTYFAELEPTNPRARELLTRMGGPVPNLPPLPRPPSEAAWYDGGGKALSGSSDDSAAQEAKEPPPGPDVQVCPACDLRTWKGWVCKHCGASLPIVR